MILFLFCALIVTTALGVSLYNFFKAPILKQSRFKIKSNSFISVLIPARNEENNITGCVTSLLKQDYENYEIIILDDNSQDMTLKIAESFSLIDPRVKSIEGLPLPANWTGKNWACHQLAEHASGNLLLFIDADVRLSFNTLTDVATVYEDKSVKMISVFPTQQIKTLGEALIVPLMNWILLSFLPLDQVYNSQNNSLLAANGQFIFIDRSTYLKIGGHRSVSSSIVEDMEFARLVKSQGYKILTLLGGESVYCRMYSNFHSSVKGFEKNLFPAFNTSVILFFILIFIILISFSGPFILVFSERYYFSLILIIVVERILVSSVSNQNVLINVLLHPIQIILVLYIGIRSVLKFKRKNISWKGRNLLTKEE